MPTKMDLLREERTGYARWYDNQQRGKTREKKDVPQDHFGFPPPYEESVSKRPTQQVLTMRNLPLPWKDPDLLRNIQTHILISSRNNNDTGIHYRRGGKIVREPLMITLDELKDRVASLTPVLPASLPEDVSHSLVDAVDVDIFRLPVLWPLADEDERTKVDVNLLSLQGDHQPVWKWTKAELTGYWHSNLDTVLEAGWWDAGRQLGLIVCGVDACMASKFDSTRVRVLSSIHRQIEAEERVRE